MEGCFMFQWGGVVFQIGGFIFKWGGGVPHGGGISFEKICGMGGIAPMPPPPLWETLTTNINLRNYAIKFTLTESSAGDMLLYIDSYLSYKPWLDLNISKSNLLEITFVEMINPKKVTLSLVVFTNIQWF